MNHIQIIATIGPASKEIATIKRMIKSGLSLARLNFSWGTHAEHRDFVKLVREAATELNVTILIIQDISGPRVQQESGHTLNSDIAVITDKDKEDIKALVDLKIEYIAQSFVKDASDVRDLRSFLDSVGSTSKIISKIERQEALDNLDEIIQASDGIMIARGDLGQAVPIEKLPFIKKDILKRCNQAGKPAIVATEMLTSMIDSNSPSRADISDITHAVLDGASATMLSNETAAGMYPIEAVAVMRKTIDEAQAHTNLKVISF